MVGLLSSELKRRRNKPRRQSQAAPPRARPKLTLTLRPKRKLDGQSPKTTKDRSQLSSKNLAILLRGPTLIGITGSCKAPRPLGCRPKNEEAKQRQQRQVAYQKLLASKRLEPISGCSDHLHSHVASHFVNAELQGRTVQLSEVLTQAVDYGHPQLAEEAQQVLASIGVKAARSRLRALHLGGRHRKDPDDV